MILRSQKQLKGCLQTAITDKTEDYCNCAKKTECPVNSKCQLSKVIYKAVVTSKDGEKVYIGSTGKVFKKRYLQHLYSFKNIDRRHTTTLAKYIWHLKDKKIKFIIKWSIVRVAVGDLILNNSCELCKLEWIEIKNHCGDNCLNKNVCQHFSTAVNSNCKIKNTFSGSCYNKK